MIYILQEMAEHILAFVLSSQQITESCRSMTGEIEINPACWVVTSGHIPSAVTNGTSAFVHLWLLYDSHLFS
jgi:hypothetical protein